LRRIRTLDIEADGETPVIETNSLGPTVLRGRALKEGFSEYLGKPFTPKKLMKTIQSVLR
jgi:CheY-like chemotaxis protein